MTVKMGKLFIKNYGKKPPNLSCPAPIPIPVPAERDVQEQFNKKKNIPLRLPSDYTRANYKLDKDGYLVYSANNQGIAFFEYSPVLRALRQQHTFAKDKRIRKIAQRELERLGLE